MLKEEVLVLIYFIATILILVFFVVVFFIAFQRRKNKLLIEQIEAEQAYEKELSRSQIEIQEHTLKNIAWELHDNIGQLLSVINLQINILSNKLPGGYDVEVNEIKGVVKQTVQEVRSLSKVLNNDVILKNGLIETLQVEVDRLDRLGYLEVSFELEGKPVAIDKASEIIIFRILQETLSNILRHAKASKLFILLHYKKECLEITVIDNGRGFDVYKKMSGSGMETMHNRAELINADLKIESEIGKGTQLLLNYRYKEDEDGKR